LYYSTILNNTDISTSNKDKTPILINNVEVYTKEQLTAENQRFTAANVQLMTDKMETERTKVNLKANKMRLLEKKNSLIVKREELRVEIATMNVIKSFNALIRGYQNPLLKLARNKLKVKRPPLFNSLKKNFQRFFIKT